jgi:hypothetical protein
VGLFRPLRHCGGGHILALGRPGDDKISVAATFVRQPVGR